MAYATLAEGRDSDGLKQLDAELQTEPGKRAIPKSTGNVAAVMAAAKMQRSPKRRSR